MNIRTMSRIVNGIAIKCDLAMHGPGNFHLGVWFGVVLRVRVGIQAEEILRNKSTV